jgi:hypothetical protein
LATITGEIDAYRNDWQWLRRAGLGCVFCRFWPQRLRGKGNFVPTEGTTTARVRLFLQQRGDTLTAQEPRWWSLAYVELHEGEFT